MDHVAIDLGGTESQICVRSGEGAIVEEVRVPTRHLGRWLKKRASSRVVVETCAEAFAVADAALSCGHQVRVVPATLVRSLGVGARGIKTDLRDARVLSERSCQFDLPSVHVPSLEARRRKSLCGMRDAHVTARTQHINCVRGWLRTQNLHLRKGARETFTTRVRELFATDKPVPRAVERLLKTIEFLSTQIEEADQELSELAGADATCRRLMSVPGVGAITALRFVAVLDDRSRFPDAHAVESYVGLTPGEDSSSSRVRRTGITKAGCPALRWTLVQASWSLRRSRPHDPMTEWSLQVEKRRGKPIAIVALARKLVGVLYAIWRDGTVYQPHRGADEVTSKEAKAGSESLSAALRKAP